MKILMTVVIVASLGGAGCAGSRQARQIDPQQTLSEQLTDWGRMDKAALIAHAVAKTPAEITQAIDGLVACVEAAPIPEARAMAEKDACLAAASAGDSADALSRFNCEKGALRKLIGEE